MAWDRMDFPFGSLLTSAKMAQISSNFGAMAAQHSGSPPITFPNSILIANAGMASTGVASLATVMAAGNVQVGSNFLVQSASMLNRALIYLTASEVIATGTLTIVPWDASCYDIGGFWNAASAGILRAPFPGRYQFTFNVGWDINPTGTRDVELMRNGARFIGGGSVYSVANSSNDFICQNGRSAVIDCASGDRFEVRVYQDRGGNLSLTNAFPFNWFAVQASP